MDTQNTHILNESEKGKIKNPASFLFVGNSFVFTGDIPAQLKALAKLKGIKITCKDISKGWASLSDTKEKSVKKLKSKKFDYVVLQDYGTRPMEDVHGFFSDIKSLCDIARENGTTPILYSPAWVNIDGQPDQKIQKIYTGGYIKAARENDTTLVNAGDAWVYAYETIPGVSLYARDLLHANAAGAFLTACVFAATLFDLQLEKIPPNNRYRGDDAPVLAKTAWDFVTRER